MHRRLRLTSVLREVSQLKPAWLRDSLVPLFWRVQNFQAGGISAALTTPLDVAKTRIMLAEAGSEASKSSTLNAMAKIYHTNGIKGKHNFVYCKDF